MWPPPRTLCAAQPHPLRFVWAFLLAGLLRAHRDAAADGRELRSAQRAGLALAADWLSCRAFSAAFARAPPTARGAVLAWLATLILVALPVRTAAAALLWRWLPPETAPRPRPRLLHAASTLALAAIKQGDVTTGKALLRDAIDTHPQHFEAAARSLKALEANVSN